MLRIVCIIIGLTVPFLLLLQAVSASFLYYFITLTMPLIVELFQQHVDLYTSESEFCFSLGSQFIASI